MTKKKEGSVELNRTEQNRTEQNRSNFLSNEEVLSSLPFLKANNFAIHVRCFNRC
jgi:hypothetical protein